MSDDVTATVDRLHALFPADVRPHAGIGLRDLMAWLHERGEPVTVEVAKGLQARWIWDVLRTAPPDAVPHTHLNYRDE